MNIIPKPEKIELRSGAYLLNQPIALSEECFAFKDLAEFLARIRIRSAFGGEKCDVVFKRSAELEREAYKLDISENGVIIEASADAGLFYAVQTLKQIFSEYKNNLPCVHIEDAPKYGFRSYMLDNGRYYYRPKDVKTIIDMASSHKLNVLHWHLTEDQGWRVEIDKYPRLTDFGSRRGHTNFNIFKSHGGYYTKSEIKEIVEYAHSRNMRVIPEIDMPGHMRAAIASYPELACFPRKLSVATHFGVKHDILCAGKERVFEFIFDVLKEIFELFPDEYIHLGGDEAFKHRWNLCPECAKRMESEGISDAEELQGWFLDRVADFCVKNGKTPMIWFYEGAQHLKNKELIFEYYFGDSSLGGNAFDKEIAQAVNEGRRIFNASSVANYLDLPYGKVSLKNSFEYDPMVAGIEKPENVLGNEACLWTEYVPNIVNAQKKTFPRLAAIAEKGWSKNPQSWEEFKAKMPAYYAYIRKSGYKISSLKKALPNKLRGKLQSLWFGRRVLHWQGLYNLIDDAKIAKRAEKEAEKAKKGAEKA